MHLALLLLYFIVIDFLTQIKFLPFSNRNGIYQLQLLRFFAQNINLFTKNHGSTGAADTVQLFATE